MTTDPRWSYETFTGATMAAFPGLPRGMTLAEAERRVTAVLRYLADAGLLLPAGGTTEVQHRYRDPDGFTIIGLSSEQVHDGDDWRLSDRRTVTRWPDDRWHFAPWQPTQPEHGAGT